jgi:hypothetical protein
VWDRNYRHSHVFGKEKGHLPEFSDKNKFTYEYAKFFLTLIHGKSLYLPSFTYTKTWHNTTKKKRTKTKKITRETSHRQLMLLLLMAGQNLLNPGPICVKCNQLGRINQLIIQCQKCHHHIHRTCMIPIPSYTDFHKIKNDNNWNCDTCIQSTTKKPYAKSAIKQKEPKSSNVINATSSTIKYVTKKLILRTNVTTSTGCASPATPPSQPVHLLRELRLKFLEGSKFHT